MAETIGLRAVMDMGQFNRGLSSYNKGIGRMNKQTSSFTKTAGGQFAKLGGGLLKFGAIAGGAALVGIGALTAGLIAFGASAVKEGAAYTKTMSNVKAITGATAEQFDALSASAEKLGRTTKFTATEAAEGMGFLAMAGFEVNEVITAMPGVLNLAAAGNLQLGQSADIVSNILTGFGAEADQTGRFVDVLTKTFTSSNTNLVQLGQAMKFVAPVAADLGLSVEQTAAAMGVLGDGGIQASMAGTTLRTALLNLAAPVGKGKALIEKLGIAVFDAQGEMLPFPEIIGNFNEAMEGMSDAQKAATLRTIIGKRAISGFSLLLKKGEAGLEAFGNELLVSGGTAAEIAATQLDNLSGDVTLFKSALSGIKIDVFKALEPVLRGVVGQGKLLLDTFGPQLATVLGALPIFIEDIISMASDLFATFQRGGIAGLAESLGITPDIIELIDKVVASATSLGQAIISFLLPGLEGLSGGGLLDLINSAITFLNENFELLQGAIIGVGAVLAGGVLAALVAGLLSLLTPINLIIAGAALLGAAWAGNWGNIQGVTMAVVNTITGVILPQLQAIFTNLTMALNSLGLNWGDIWTAIATATALVIGAVIVTIGGLVTGISTALAIATGFVSDFGMAFRTIIEGVATIFAGVINLFTALISGEWASAWDSFLLIVQGANTLFLGIIDLIATTIQASFSTMLGFISGFVLGVIDLFTGLSNTLVGNSIIPDMAMAIIDVFTGMVEPILSVFSTLSEGIATVLGAIFGGGGEEAQAPTMAFDPAEMLAGMELVDIAIENVNLGLTNINTVTIPLLQATFLVMTTMMIEQLLLLLNTGIMPVDLAFVTMTTVTLPNLQATAIAVAASIITAFTPVQTLINALIVLVDSLTSSTVAWGEASVKAGKDAEKAFKRVAERINDGLVQALKNALTATENLRRAMQEASTSARDLGGALEAQGIGFARGIGFQAGTPANTNGLLGLGFRIPPGFPNDSFGPFFAQSGEEMLITPRGTSIEGLIFSRLADLLRGTSVQGGGVTNNITNVEMNLNLQTTSSAPANMRQFNIQRGLLGV